jgi:zinc transporter ZupT
MFKAVLMGIVAIVLSFYLTTTFTNGVQKTNAQTTSVTPSISQSTTNSSSNTAAVTPVPSVIVPSGAPRTGFQP